MEWISAVPRVSVSNWPRNPISPREGMRNSMRTRPEPWLTISASSPRRVPRLSMMIPM